MTSCSNKFLTDHNITTKAIDDCIKKSFDDEE